MTEAAVLAALAAAGSWAWTPAARRSTSWERVAVAFPVGLGLYLVLGWSAAISPVRFSPWMGLTSVVTVGIVIGSISVLRDRSSTRRVITEAILVGAIAFLLSALLQLVPIAHLTFDSYQYLIEAATLVATGDHLSLSPYNLIYRQLVMPVLYSLAVFSDRPHMPSLMPVLGCFSLMLFGVMTHRITRLLDADETLSYLLLVLALGLMLVSNRPVFNAFYLHTHLVFALYLFVVVAGSWLAIATDRWAWWALVALSLPILVGIRPEGFIVAVLALVPVLCTPQARYAARVALASVFCASVFLWYGLALLPHAGTGDVDHAPAAVALGLVVFVGTLLVRGDHRASLASVIPVLTLVVLVLVLVGFIIQDPVVFTDSLRATRANLIDGEGAWRWTWIGMPLLILLAFYAKELDHGWIWYTPLFAYAVLFFLLPYLRDDPYRVGQGDSGNRMLFHVLFVGTSIVVVSAASAVRGCRSGRPEESTAA